MANQEALIAEYSALRQDISQAEQKLMQFVGSALAVASVFIVYGFQAQNSLAFLAANIILLGTIYIVANSKRHRTLAATYLYAIVEPKVVGLQWETMVESHKRENRSPLRLSYPISILIGALFSIGCVFFAWLFLQDHHTLNMLLYSCITVILEVSFVILSFITLRVSSNKYRSDCVSRWKKIEEELYPTVAAIHMKSEQTSHKTH